MSDKPDLPVPADIAGLVEETTIGLSDLIEQESYEILPWVRTALRGVRQNVKTIVATLSRENAAQAGEIERLNKLVFVPGVLKCKKCGFGLIKTNLHVQTGNFSANNEPDYCPNDGAPLWRVTERDAGNEQIDIAATMSDDLRQLREEAVDMRNELTRLRALMTDEAALPFVVQYRGKVDGVSPITWRTMAAFDAELAAQRYFEKQESEHWEYRFIEIQAAAPGVK